MPIKDRAREARNNSSRKAKYGERVKVSRRNRPDKGKVGRGKVTNNVSVSMHPDAVARRARLPVYLSSPSPKQ